MISVFQRLVSILLIFSFCYTLPAQKVFAEENQLNSKTVTVGYYTNTSAAENNSDAKTQTSYSYEYLQMIANYTGWEFEYVYGSWSEILNKFMNGELDLMIDVAYTQERTQWMLFPDYIMGTEPFYICTAANDDHFDAFDLSTFHGARIGVNENSIQKEFLEDWINENNLNVEIVPNSATAAERNEYLKTGEIDLVVEMSRHIDANLVPIIVLPSSDYYLVVAADRPDLLNELNSALISLNDAMPHYVERLREKYFPEVVINTRLSEKEIAYLSNRDEIRIGYLDNYLPFSDYDETTGTSVGTVVDLFDAMQDTLDFHGVSVKYIPYPTFDELMFALFDKEIDIHASLYYNLQHAIKNNILLSSSYTTVPMNLVYQGNYEPDTIKRIAVARDGPTSYYYAEDKFPEIEPALYDSIDDCINAVLSGDADAAIVNSFLAQYYIKGSQKYKSLNFFEYPDRAPISFGISKEDIGLLTLLDRGISVVPDSVVSGSIAVNAAHRQQYTATDFFSDYIWHITTGASIAVMVIILIVSMLRHKNEKEKMRQMNETNALFQKQNELLEAALEQSQQAARSKSLFLSNMSHDIRTPMNAIIGFVTLAEKHLDNRDALQEYHAKINTSSKHLLKLIDDILYMSDAESENIILQENECNLKEILQELQSSVKSEIYDKELHFTYNFDGICNEHILCDEARLKKALLNILTNAVKFTKPHGSVFFTAKEHGEAIDGYRTYEFRIRDTGIGMSEEFLKYVFDPFERARTSTVSGLSGTGLGLPICKNIVDMMKGTIVAESEEGVGSEFIITLTFRCWTPKNDAAPEPSVSEEVKAAADEVNFTDKRLLLVEDNELNREIAYEILTEVGFLVEEAEDGKIAVDKISHSTPGYFNAVLMDIQMPVMDGYEATREIRKLDVHKKLPIIALTANTLDEDKKKALKAGMNAHVGKPIDIDKLLSTLSEFIA